VKIGPLGSETQVLECRPLKNIKNKEKTSAKYIALLASVASRLKNNKDSYFLKIWCTYMYIPIEGDYIH